MVERGELIERLEKAIRPDPYLDEAIRSFFCLPTIGWAVAPYNYTDSLDATIALVERVLPGVWWEVSSGPVATLQLVDNRYICADGATPAIALLIALVKAGETQ